jgi:hypothetical protein
VTETCLKRLRTTALELLQQQLEGSHNAFSLAEYDSPFQPSCSNASLNCRKSSDVVEIRLCIVSAVSPRGSWSNYFAKYY